MAFLEARALLTRSLTPPAVLASSTISTGASSEAAMLAFNSSLLPGTFTVASASMCKTQPGKGIVSVTCTNSTSWSGERQ
jgi:hypothetical protein